MTSKPAEKVLVEVLQDELKRQSGSKKSRRRKLPVINTNPLPCGMFVFVERGRNTVRSRGGVKAVGVE